MADFNDGIFHLRLIGDKWGVSLANVLPKDSPRGLGDTPAEALRSLADYLDGDAPAVQVSESQPEPKFANRAAGSSSILSFEYDVDSRVLTVQFPSGSYEYYNVPEEVYERLRDTDGSRGQFLNNHVKGLYEYKKLQD
jgi:hypothetical protein